MIRTTEQRHHEENEVETKEDGVIMKDMIWVRTKWRNVEKVLERDGWNKTFKQEEVSMNCIVRSWIRMNETLAKKNKRETT